MVDFTVIGMDKLVLKLKRFPKEINEQIMLGMVSGMECREG